MLIVHDQFASVCFTVLHRIYRFFMDETHLKCGLIIQLRTHIHLKNSIVFLYVVALSTSLPFLSETAKNYHAIVRCLCHSYSRI